MNFWGVILNSLGVAVGGLIGTKFGEKIPLRLGETLISGLGLCILFIGVSGVTNPGNLIVTVISIALGAVLGELVDFEGRINAVGAGIQEKLDAGSSEDSEMDFGSAFVSTTLLLSMGAMSIMGSLESGMLGDPTTLLTKALIDTVTVTILASTMGIGVPFSAIPLFMYQGGLTLLAGVLAPLMSDLVINQMSTIGSVLIIGVALNMLNITKIRVGNLVLAPFLPMVFALLK